MVSFTDRMIRAAKLEVNLYEEVEADKGAMRQAMGTEDESILRIHPYFFMQTSFQSILYEL